VTSSCDKAGRSGCLGAGDFTPVGDAKCGTRRPTGRGRPRNCRPELISNLILFGYPRDPDAPAPPQNVPAEPARETNTRARAVSDFISPDVISQNVIEAFVAAALIEDSHPAFIAAVVSFMERSDR
jgi:hypothetical protein